MAAREDDDFRARRRKRELEEAEETEEAQNDPAAPTAGSIKLDELMTRAEPLIEQVNSLYSQFMNGTERAPPNERRRQLDQLMTTIMMMHKPTPTQRFRATGVMYTYQQYKDRWERMIRDLESGKIKRRGPGA